MTTLIIGAGLVGSQIARILIERGEKPVLMDHAPQPAAMAQIFDPARATLIEGDILRPLSIAKAIVDHKPARIALTAANPMLTIGAQRDPYAAINLNIMGTVNVLEAARVHGVARVVVSGSSVVSHFMVGGDGSRDVMREEGLPRPSTFYATTKQALENLGLNYARWCGVDFAAMRYAAVFGPWSGAGGGGPSNTMRAAMLKAMAGEEAVLPATNVEWVYSKDAALGTVLALEAKSLASRVFNLTMGTLSTPQQTADAFRALIPGARVRIETPAATAVSMPQMTGVGDMTLSQSVLGYAPQYDLIGGLRDLMHWLKAHPR